MISSIMFVVTFIYSLVIISMYDQKHWIPQSPEEAIAEMVLFVMLFCAYNVYLLEESQRKLNETGNSKTNNQ